MLALRQAGAARRLAVGTRAIAHRPLPPLQRGLALAPRQLGQARPCRVSVPRNQQHGCGGSRSSKLFQELFVSPRASAHRSLCTKANDQGGTSGGAPPGGTLSKKAPSPPPVPPRWTPAWIVHVVRKEAAHYYHGAKLLAADCRVASRLLGRLVTQRSLTRREHNLLVRVSADIARLVPLTFFVVVPMMEFALPFAIRIFPNLLPSTFEEKHQVEERRKKLLKVKKLACARDPLVTPAPPCLTFLTLPLVPPAPLLLRVSFSSRLYLWCPYPRTRVWTCPDVSTGEQVRMEMAQVLEHTLETRAEQVTKEAKARERERQATEDLEEARRQSESVKSSDGYVTTSAHQMVSGVAGGDANSATAAFGTAMPANLRAFMTSMREEGTAASPDELLKVMRGFKDNVTLDHLYREQLVAIAQFLGMNAFAPTAILRFQLRSRLRKLRNEDKEIMWEGTDSVSVDELRADLRNRGLPTAKLTREQMVETLDGWLALSQKKELPYSLLIMTNMLKFAAQREEQIETVQAQEQKARDQQAGPPAAAAAPTAAAAAAATPTADVEGEAPGVVDLDLASAQQVLSSLPLSAEASSDDKSDAKEKLESLRREEMLIEEEREVTSPHPTALTRLYLPLLAFTCLYLPCLHLPSCALRARRAVLVCSAYPASPAPSLVATGGFAS